MLQVIRLQSKSEMVKLIRSYLNETFQVTPEEIAKGVPKFKCPTDSTLYKILSYMPAASLKVFMYLFCLNEIKICCLPGDERGQQLC